MVTESRNSPTSTNWDEEDLFTTKDLTQGMKSIDNGIVGCQDPCTSLEALAKGTSTKCSETTPVVLKSVAHKTQTKPQSSLLLTPGPPVDGEPCECKQEVADSNMTVGHMNGTVQLAEPMEITDVDLEKAALGGEPVERASRVDKGSETDVDIDRTAMLGRDLTTACGVDEGGETDTDVDRTAMVGRDPTTACGVDEGDKMECKPQSQPQEMKLLYGEIDQCNGNTENNIPITYGLPLEGEWAVYPSGETRNSNSGSGQEVKPADSWNELETLITTSIKSKDPDSGEIPCVCLGSTHWRVGDISSPGCQMDWSSGHADGSRGLMDGLGGLMDASNESHNAETDRLDHGKGAETYLSAGDAKRVVVETDGIGSHADTLNGHGEVQSVEMDTLMPTNAPVNDSIPQKKGKLPDLPMETTRGHPDEPDGCGNHADASSVHTDVHGVRLRTETAANKALNIRRCQIDLKTQNAPNVHETKLPKATNQWRKVSTEDISVYVPWNMPVGVLGRTLVFGEAESQVKAIVPDVEGETAEGTGDSDGDQDGDSNSDGTMSDSSIDSNQVNAMLLAEKSQHMAQTQRIQDGGSPVSPVPPIYHADHPYGHIRHCCQ